MNILYFETIDSTNTYLKKNYLDLKHNTWLSTNHQTSGKGRISKSWYGNENSLMCSLLLKTNLAYDQISLIPLLAVKSLHQVLIKYHPDIKIKWPNDLLIDNKKIAGILVESMTQENKVTAIIIGFGININHQTFTPEIKDLATSLFLKTNQVYDKEIIYQELIKQFDMDYQAYQNDSQFIIDYCNLHHALTNKTITFTNLEVYQQAKVITILANGHLLVKAKDKEISLSSGEVSILK
jgi:BirA family transcriptional regulator, biotin operon repressor / biotin---[acetyl-CoA-carboxylase] ligase